MLKGVPNMREIEACAVYTEQSAQDYAVLKDVGTNQSIKGGVCLSHGARAKRCSVEGCNKHGREGGVCISHGAKREKCKSRGCSTIARRGDSCFSHAQNTQCLVEGCDNIAAVRGCYEKHANCNIYSKESNNSTMKDVDSDNQPQHSEQVGPSVCLVLYSY